MEGTMIHTELSREIIGAAMTVMNTLRPGLDEKVYETRCSSNCRREAYPPSSSNNFRFITRVTSSVD
jgi:hypothetical protein